MNSFEIDKARFGQFLAEERKRQGLTQKELARRLFLSDKAVSKWERGLSLPDVTLLIPLARELGVTVTELLEGRRLDTSRGMEMAEVEHLVKKTLSLSAEGPEPRQQGRGKRLALWLLCLGIALGEYGAIFFINRHFTLGHFCGGSSLAMEFLLVIFSAWFCLGARERLPAYYDENRISIYADGIFRMSIPGVSFNNRNWPPILRWMRGWSLTALVALPALFTVLEILLGFEVTNWVMLALFLGSLFLPPYFVARKHQ